MRLNERMFQLMKGLLKNRNLKNFIVIQMFSINEKSYPGILIFVG